MIALSIDGKELTKLNIIKYTPKYELLDGEGTARTKADGWELIRQPQGIIVNFSVTIMGTSSDNEDFVHFMNTLYSLGEKEFVPVSHIDPTGREISQEMYFNVDGIDFIRLDDDNIYTGDITARFIAKKGL